MQAILCHHRAEHLFELTGLRNEFWDIKRDGNWSCCKKRNDDESEAGGSKRVSSDLAIYTLARKAKSAIKWFDFKKRPLVFVLGAPTVVDAWTFTTASDLPKRDPVRWSLEGEWSGGQ